MRVWKHVKGKNTNNGTFVMEQKLLSILASFKGSEVSIIPPEEEKKRKPSNLGKEGRVREKI